MFICIVTAHAVTVANDAKGVLDDLRAVFDILISHLVTQMVIAIFQIVQVQNHHGIIIRTHCIGIRVNDKCRAVIKPRELVMVRTVFHVLRAPACIDQLSRFTEYGNAKRNGFSNDDYQHHTKRAL